MKKQIKETPEQIHLRETEIVRKEKALHRYLENGHGMPRTRREFLGSGVLAGLAYVALPSFATLISREANAQLSNECKTLLDPAGAMMPYLQIVLGGGAAIHQNSLVLDEGRELLSSYHRLGLGRIGSFSTKTEFGNVPLAVRNGQYAGYIMKGLTNTAGPDAIKNTSLVKFCVTSLDDKANRDGILGLVNAAGLKGTLLPNAASGGITKPAFVVPGPTQRVTALSGLLSSLSPQGALKTQMSTPSRRDALLKLVNKLSAGQRARLSESASGAELGRFVECATGKNIELATVDTRLLDPRTNSTIASIWGISSNTEDDNVDLLRASITMNVLNGYSGGGSLSRGGFDYHGSPRSEQDETDLQGGILIGRVLKTAHVLRKPVFIHVTSDGSVEGGGDDGTERQGADAGSRGSGFFMVYDPNGRRPTTDIQIGHFNQSQAVDSTFMSGWNTERCALAVFANYLQLHGKLELLDRLVPGVFSASDLKKIVKVA